MDETEIPPPKTATPIRVLFVIPGLQTGGAEMMLQKLLLSMNRRKFEPVVISLTGDGAIGPVLKRAGIPVFNLNWRPGTVPYAGCVDLIRKLRRIRPQIVQGWMYHGNLTALLATRGAMLRVPVAWGIRGIHTDLGKEKWLTAFVIWLSAKLSKFSDKIIYNSQRSKIRHEAELGYSELNGVVIPNGFETNKFIPRPGDKSRLRQNLRLPINLKLVGLFARHHPMKDHISFLRAAALLVGKRQDVAFVMAGEEIDPGNESLMSQIRELKLGCSISLVGIRNDMQDLIAAMDLVALTSAYGESFPNVIGEAMSCGIPCIVTDVGDSGYIVGDSGCVVSPRDVPGIAAEMDRILELTDSERAALGERGRSRIVEHFDIRSVIGRYEELYLNLLEP